MRTISLKLPDDLFDRLESEARARQTTISSLVRESLEQSLRTRRRAESLSCYDLASDLAGALKGLPGDLADNPKYLKGFGE
jgi:predicted DNA-binding protein